MQKLYFFFQFLKNFIFYFFSEYKRYAQLLLIVFFKRPKSIVEIGVYKGKRSKELIEVARIFNNTVNYYGFDLFDIINEKIFRKESSKFPDKENVIKNKISRIAKVKLFKGFTNKTLPFFKKKVDLVFIDGGHSIKTISNDWYYVKSMMHKNTYVIFDDYYSNSKNYSQKFGCNKTINQLSNDYKMIILPIKDKIKRLRNLGVQMVLVRKKII
jgi:hypothetical protein